MKYSRQREIVQNIIKKAHNHPTVDEVYAEVRKEDKNISLATVYRNLNLLVQCGEIKKLNFFDEENRFDPITKEHQHFVCNKCGKIIDINDNAFSKNTSIDKKIEKEYDISIDRRNVVLYGVCKNCK